MLENGIRTRLMSSFLPQGRGVKRSEEWGDCYCCCDVMWCAVLQWRVLPDESAKRGPAVSVSHLDADNHQAGVALCSAPVCGGGAGAGSRQREGQLRHLLRQEKARACRLTESCCAHYPQTITNICITSQSVRLWWSYHRCSEGRRRSEGRLASTAYSGMLTGMCVCS